MQISVYHPELQQVDAVIFDMDGTLYNNKGWYKRLIAGNLSHLAYLIREHRVRRSLRGRSFSSKAEFEKAYFGENNRFHRWYQEQYLLSMIQLLSRHYHSEAWARELITELRRRNIKICVYSDFGCVVERMRTLGYQLSDFDCVVSSFDLGGLKSNPDSMMQILAKLGVKSERCLVIGSHADTDEESARAVGARFLLVK